MSGAAVGIYRKLFLPPSETFIADHITALKRWRPIPLCTTEVEDGLTTEGPKPLPLAPQEELEAALTRSQVRLLHAHFLIDAVDLLNLTRTTKLPLIVTAHGYDATVSDADHEWNEYGRLYVSRRAELIKVAALILCVSEFIREELIEKGYPPEKLRVQSLGIDLDLYRPGRRAGERQGVLFAGRLVPKKGGDFLIRAWKMLPNHVKTQGLTIVGDGPEREQMRQLAAGDRTIRFMGRQPREVVRKEMENARIFATPSIRAKTGDSEGLPIVAMEAQALGTPMVVFDEGPMREAIAPDLSGLIVPARDVAAYADALEQVLTDDELATRLGSGGPPFVAARFDLYKNSAKLERIYDELAQSW